MEPDIVRDRLKAQGWKVIEIPVHKNNEIVKWKLIAVKGEKSYDVYGKTIEETMLNLGKVLGVVSRNI